MSELKPKIAPASTVRMHFSMTLQNGIEAISSFGEEPLNFTLGDGTLEKGLEEIIKGLKAGDEKTFTVDGNLIYGERDESNIHNVPLTRFPVGIEPAPGLIVSFNAADNTEVPGSILEVGDTEAKVDFNHPLAGREFQFRVKILEVTAPA